MRLLSGILLCALSLGACSPKSDDNAANNQAVVTPLPKATSTTASVPVATPAQQGIAQAPAVAARPGAPAAVVPTGVLTVSTKFKCKDGSAFIAEFRSQPRHAEIIFDKQPRLSLPQMDAASGFRYRSDQYELRGKGPMAMWTVAGKTPVTCEASLGRQ